MVLVPPAQGAGNPGSAKIIKPFLDFADSTYPNMYHCHILEHEDRGMMGQYIVIDTTTLDTTSIERTNNENLETHIFPNPVNNQQIQIQFSTTIAGAYTFTLLNPNGQVIRTFYQNIFIRSGTAHYSLDLDEIAQGLYFLSIKSEQYQLVKKLIKL